MRSAAARAAGDGPVSRAAVGEGAGNVQRVMEALALAISGLDLPAVEKISESQEENPFQVLIATLLSARTQDATTLAASTRLFRRARTPRTMAALTVKEIERLIYPVSFYRHKARHLKAACQLLVERFGGKVPGTMDDLLTLPGVGRKTANLVLILSFKSQRNICVDTHVHRISNRLGWVVTRTPEETEQALYAATDSHWWPYINLYLVTWGQNVCRPVYPRCGECVLRPLCPQVGVERVAKARGAASRQRPGGLNTEEETS
jgi:endonuclease-3